MQKLELVGRFNFGGEVKTKKDIEAKQLYNGPKRQIMQVKLRNKAVLSKHRASEPITIFCLAGKGLFLAGEDLEEQQKLETGTLLTLEAEVVHEVKPEPELSIIVTKHKED